MCERKATMRLGENERKNASIVEGFPFLFFPYKTTLLKMSCFCNVSCFSVVKLFFCCFGFSYFFFNFLFHFFFEFISVKQLLKDFVKTSHSIITVNAFVPEEMLDTPTSSFFCDKKNIIHDFDETFFSLSFIGNFFL